MSKLVSAIGATDLITYFEYLDTRGPATPGQIDAAARSLLGCWRGMTRQEARAIARAWDRTWSITLPAEDRAMNALEAA